MYKNEVLSGIGLSITQNAIGSIVCGVGMYQLSTRHFKISGWKLASMVVLGVVVGSMVESAITLPKFKN